MPASPIPSPGLTTDPGFSRPSSVLLAMDSYFAYQATSWLLRQAYRPQTVILAGQAPTSYPPRLGEIEIETKTENLAALCLRHQLRWHYQADIPLEKFIAGSNTDFLLVACWPDKITRPIIDSVRHAALNLHPSMLPDYRGRYPVIDQLNADETRFGVSLHLIDDEFDRGDIVLQQDFELEPPVSRRRIEKRAARLGAELFLQALDSHARPGWQLIRQG